MSDRLAGIMTFVQAAEAGSFSRAARRAGLSRSAVGKSIARLEERLGVRLFHRTTRNQALTDDGQAFYERCVRALAELETAEAALDSGRRTPSGVLKISAPVLFGRYCAAPILIDFARRHPQLELDLSFTDRQTDLIEGGLDLVVRIGPLVDRAGLTVRKLGAFGMVVCAAPSYIAQRGRPSSVAELSGHEVFPYSRSGRAIPWQLIDADGQRHEARIQGRYRLDDLQAIVDVAVAGAGLAFLPCWLIADHLHTGALVALLKGIDHDVYAVWPQTQHLVSKVRMAIDELAARIPAAIAAGSNYIARPRHGMKAGTCRRYCA